MGAGLPSAGGHAVRKMRHTFVIPSLVHNEQGEPTWTMYQICFDSRQVFVGSVFEVQVEYESLSSMTVL